MSTRLLYTLLVLFGSAGKALAVCATPTAPTATSITSASAVLNWAQTGTPISYQIKYGTAGFAVATAGTSVFTTTKPFTLNPPLASLTSYDYYVRSICAAGDTSAWSVVTNFTTLCNAPSIVSKKDSFKCGTGPVTLEATTTLGATLKWYNVLTGGTSIGTGGSFTTPSISTTTNYYVEAVGLASIGSPGRNDYTGILQATPNSTGQGIQFNAASNFNLDSVAVWVTNDTGTIIVQLQNSSNAVLATNTFSFSGSGATATLRKKIFLNVNYSITTGTSYKILAMPGTTVPLSREQSVSPPFATYTISGVVTMVSSWVNGAINSANYYYFYNFYVSAGCASPRQAVVATIKPRPTASVTPAGPATFCAGGSLALSANTGTGFTYQWQQNNSNIVAAAATYNATTAGNYRVVVANNGCTDTSANVTVTAAPLPVASITAGGPISFCTNDSVLLSGTAVTGNTYQWQKNNINIVGANGSSYYATTSGNYRMYVFNGNCADTSAAIAVTANALPSVTVTPAATSVCSGTSTVLTASGSTGTYNWSPSGSLSAATGTTVAATPGATTTYVVSSTVAGCTGSANAVVTVLNTPNTAISPATPIAICIGSSTTLTASGADTYSWSPAGSLSSATAAVVTATPGATVTYTVVGTNLNGCSSSATKLVTVNALPAVDVTPATATSICPGSNVTLTANGATSYSWTPAASLSASTGTTVVAAPIATTTYTVTGTDNNGCSNTATKLVTVSIVNIAISPATAISFCGSGSATLTASGGVSYTWSPATNLTTTTGATVIATPTVTRTYTVTALDANGCTGTATKTITVNTIPTVSITPATTTTICEGSSVLLTGNGASTYSWTPSASLSSPTGTTVTASPITTTTYILTGTSAAGCSATATKTVNVNAAPPVVVTPATTTTFCIGNSVVLTASGAVNYTWSPATGLSATTGTTVTATPATTTTYTITGTGANGCTKAVTQTVTVNPLPVLTVTPAAPTVCLGSGVVLNVSGANTYSWSPAATLSAPTGATVTASPVVNTTYTINAIDVNGCAASTTKLVTVITGPNISVSPTSATTCSGNPVVLSASGGISYSWSPAVNLSATTGAVITATPTSTTTYTVTGTAANGCSNTANATITVNPLPNLAIAPGGLNLSCQETPVTLTASGAVTYSWYPSAALSTTTGATVVATPNTSMVYFVTGTDANGCVSTTNSAVTRYAIPSAAITPSGQVEFCNGATTHLQAAYANHPSYRWQLNGVDIPGATTNNLLPGGNGTYTIKVTDTNGCTATTDVPAIVTYVAIPTPVITASGLRLTVGNSFQSYQWYYNGAVIPGATSATYDALRDGFYTVVVSNSTMNGCTGTSAAYHVTSLAVSNAPLAKQIRLYPNPATSLITIDAPVPVSVLVTGMDGRLMLKKERATELDITNLADGIYNVVITDANGKYIRNEKVVKMTR